MKRGFTQEIIAEAKALTVDNLEFIRAYAPEIVSEQRDYARFLFDHNRAAGVKAEHDEAMRARHVEVCARARARAVHELETQLETEVRAQLEAELDTTMVALAAKIRRTE